MKIKEITVARTRKINLGNYENTDVFVSITALTDENSDIAVLCRELAEKVENELETLVTKINS